MKLQKEFWLDIFKNTFILSTFEFEAYMYDEDGPSAVVWWTGTQHIKTQGGTFALLHTPSSVYSDGEEIK